MNTPNKITLFRVILIPVFIIVFLCGIPDRKTADIIALVIFSVASMSDFLDGYLARKHNMVTDFGKLMDPLADKLLVCITLICFVKLRGADSVGDYAFPTWCAIIIMTREFAISGLRQLAADKGVIIAAGMWGKVKTVVQLFMCIDYIIMPEFLYDLDMEWFAIAGVVLMYLATALTIISLLDYLLRNRKVLKISCK
ncbi:MAG: CDP-diacylglycerol--glycerol-3-phosphate 3-phosphatidyltransferase [Lachnospiraceae bacterium]|nr:CDP-diacylglycerol--glycerol-3-phosphate 3-phosphatidyltransferase [Lachnospiraceae bacterium]